MVASSLQLDNHASDMAKYVSVVLANHTVLDTIWLHGFWKCICSATSTTTTCWSHLEIDRYWTTRRSF
jgi:hypothetical protein